MRGREVDEDVVEGAKGRVAGSTMGTSGTSRRLPYTTSPASQKDNPAADDINRTRYVSLHVSSNVLCLQLHAT